MTRDFNNFSILSMSSESGSVTFGDDFKGKIIGTGNIKIDSSPLIKIIALIEGLKHNLLSISQGLFLMTLLVI